MKQADPEALSEVQRILRCLRCEAGLCSPALFPSDRDVADKPGLYSWWADEPARKLFGEVLLLDIPPLVYVGQAGATQWPSAKKSSSTLASRIRGNHINGNASSSTFRKTVSAILLEPMGLRLGKPSRLIPEDRKRVFAWIKEHLRVTIVACVDRDSLKDLEKQVLKYLDTPLNLQGIPLTPVRRRLSDLRKRITAG